MPDHVHVLIGLKPYRALSDLVQVLKKESSNFINDKKWVAGKFNWQSGYGYFSHSHSELDVVVKSRTGNFRWYLRHWNMTAAKNSGIK